MLIIISDGEANCELLKISCLCRKCLWSGAFERKVNLFLTKLLQQAVLIGHNHTVAF